MKLDQATMDRLRELGATDDMLKWLEHPEAVRALLAGDPTDRNGECIGANQTCGGSPYHSHVRACEVAAAWHALGDPRGDADVELAHEDALLEDRRLTHNAEVARKAAEDRARIRASLQSLTPEELRQRFEQVRGGDTMEEFVWWSLQEGYIDAAQAKLLAPNMPEGGPPRRRLRLANGSLGGIRISSSNHMPDGSIFAFQAS